MVWVVEVGGGWRRVGKRLPQIQQVPPHTSAPSLQNINVSKSAHHLLGDCQRPAFERCIGSSLQCFGAHRRCGGLGRGMGSRSGGQPGWDSQHSLLLQQCQPLAQHKAALPPHQKPYLAQSQRPTHPQGFPWTGTLASTRPTSAPPSSGRWCPGGAHTTAAPAG